MISSRYNPLAEPQLLRLLPLQRQHRRIPRGDAQHRSERRGFQLDVLPAATELETIVMDWLAKMLRLPEAFLFSGGGGGVLQGTTCEGLLCTLTAARDRVLKKIGREHIGKLVVYGSDQTHCALQKAAQIAGIHPENFRAVGTTRKDAFALNPASLRAAVAADVARASCRSSSAPPSAPPPPPPSTRWRGSARWPRRTTCGCTSTQPTPAARASCPRSGTSSTA
ncbi:unnamed protein product [Spirodela intermedia]|uniref:Uncharacterized protein n=1 Tax=Spirodela intermedia TaxID=51605 RepID=A0A7I8JUW0_SPIIN|nr:unnamed protein product [Spirodela intermedia]CAA6673242.1 unnamed protein product [Spirodela intermedia]